MVDWMNDWWFDCLIVRLIKYDKVIDWLDIIYELRSKLIERLMDGCNDWVIN